MGTYPPIQFCLLLLVQTAFTALLVATAQEALKYLQHAIFLSVQITTLQQFSDTCFVRLAPETICRLSQSRRLAPYSLRPSGKETHMKTYGHLSFFERTIPSIVPCQKTIKLSGRMVAAPPQRVRQVVAHSIEISLFPLLTNLL